MNIMPFYPDPYKSVRVLDDKRIGPLLKGAVQILSADGNGPYKPAWLHHPVVKWALENPNHMEWVEHWADALYEEYQYRFNRPHKSGQLLEQYYPLHTRHALLDCMPKKFCNAARRKDMNIDCTQIRNVHQAYREYIVKRWISDKRKPTWTNRPTWGGLQWVEHWADALYEEYQYRFKTNK